MRKQYINLLINYRYIFALLSLLFTFLIATGAKDLYIESDYKVFFKDDDKYLTALEEMEDTFVSGNNLRLVFEFADSTIFTEKNLKILYELTDELWQTPYSIRVDSISNFQHTSADGEDLNVTDLILEPAELTPERIAQIRDISFSEKALARNLFSVNERAAAINVTLELPPSADKEADYDTKKTQRAARDASVNEVTMFARELASKFEQRYPEMTIYLSGVAVVNNSFSESSAQGIATVIPAMFILIIVLLALFFRSIGSVVSSLLVIICSGVAAVSIAGFLGYVLNSVNIMVPMIVLVIAVCDCVHLLMIYLRGLSQQLSVREAMSESIRINFQPIVLTSVTTAVGFFTLNFASSPPFIELGNMVATGVLSAMVLTFTLLPAVTMLIVRKHSMSDFAEGLFDRYSDFIVKNYKSVFVVTSLVSIGLMLFIPLNKIDDNTLKYFKERVPLRIAGNFSIENGFGVNDLYFVVDCGEPGCVNDIETLQQMDEFDQWLLEQPEVSSVNSYVDVIKRLNRSMNRDDEAFYKIPDNLDLSAQYNLMYEMSLPYGLDLNNLTNIDKSKTRFQLMLEDIGSAPFVEFEQRATQWFNSRYEQDEIHGASLSLMFAHIGETNIRSMLWGAVIAVIGVTLTIFIALRSFRYAAISMIPNSFPALIGFGVWGIISGEVNMVVATVFSITLGILVDDTVHFISKYRRAREVKRLSKELSIKYAFANVGSALVVTTVALVAGFSMLMFSDFNLNSMTGALSALTIAIALVFDFLMLPILLMFFDKDDVVANS